MVRSQFRRIIPASLFLLLFQVTVVCAEPVTMVSGKVISREKREAVDFATVYLKGTTHGCVTDEQGVYRLPAPAGTYTLVISAVGYETVEKPVTLVHGERSKLNVLMTPSVTELGEVVVVSNGVSRVRKSAFNTVALDAKELYNSTKSLSEALNQLPGMKLREAGGVGSNMQLMLDGFSGKHVKVFIDGVPQEGTGTAFDLNNIPVNFAERIEVYKGVVPVGFGTDAIGGVINIVTNRNKGKWFADASYSYGSFNTHKSYVNFGQTFGNGWTYEINAFQNFSDNDYSIDNWVRTFTVNEDGTVTRHPVDKNDIRRVRRFNDRFHNEAVTGKIGVTDKKWADRLMLGFGYSHYYKEIQTGVYQETVFGRKHRHGHSFAPSLEYRKRNLPVKGLDVTLTANYNHNITNNVDTAARYYNWYGDYYIKDSRGEQSYQHSRSKNTNGNVTANLTYRPGEAHTFVFHHVLSTFKRTGRSYTGTSSALTSFDIPKITRKNIGGLSYRLMPSGKWNASVFAKYYRQYNRGPVSASTDGVGNYVNMDKTVSSWGYGAAGTYYLFPDLQAKLSYERACRLPSVDELFGDEDLEAGKTDLKPENSHNINFNLGYSRRWGKHRAYVEGSLIYRDTKDYIKRGIGKHGSLQYGIYENHGHVRTKGYNLTGRYSYSRWFSVGATFTGIDTRDREPKYTGGSDQENVHYNDRLPNVPYRYANFDVSLRRHNLFAEGNTLSLMYDSFWQHEFPLYWESIGDKESKNYVPGQFSHNLSLSYSLKKGRYNLSLECRNFTDARLYDNFSLQRAGRAFYAKVRVHLGQ